MISVLRNYLSRLKSGKGDIHPKTLREETVDVSRLIRVFVNNVVGHR